MKIILMLSLREFTSMKSDDVVGGLHPQRLTRVNVEGYPLLFYIFGRFKTACVKKTQSCLKVNFYLVR